MPKRPWTGAEGGGNPIPKPEESRKVIEAMRRHVGSLNSTSEEALVAETGVEGRQVRALSQADGSEFVLCNPGDKRLYICVYRDQSVKTTRSLRSRVRKLNERLERRDRFADTLPRLQGALDLDESEPDDDDEPEPEL